MAATPKAKGRAKKASGTPRRRRGVKLRPTELGATELALETPPDELKALADAIRADGGAVLATYREPLGGHALMLAALPLEKIAPTPFQRDISDAHVRRLTQAMDKTKRFLDPIIVVREQTESASYWTPNGYHRLTALKELGAKSILALVVPERAVAYQILALNIEKAHNLREKAIGVRRMYEDLAAVAGAKEDETDLRAGVRGAGAGDAGVRLSGARAALGRRLPFDPAQGRRVAARAPGRRAAAAARAGGAAARL